MIVALDLERDRPAVADIDDPRVFLARFDENVRPARRKFLQLAPRIFVGAMLAPHDGENAELGEIRLPAENLLDALEFVRRQTMFRDELRRDYGIESNRHLLRTLADVASHSTRESCWNRLAKPAAPSEQVLRQESVHEQLHENDALLTLASRLISPFAFAQTTLPTEKPRTRNKPRQYDSRRTPTGEPGNPSCRKSGRPRLDQLRRRRRRRLRFGRNDVSENGRKVNRSTLP